MDRVFIDTNVLVDWLTQRRPFADHSTKIIELVERRLLAGVLNPLVIANTYYVTATYLDKPTTRNLLTDFTSLFEIVDVSRQHVVNAVEKASGDFEDEIHVQTMLANDVKTVITRNSQDFARASLNAYTPSEYLERLHSTGVL